MRSSVLLIATSSLVLACDSPVTDIDQIDAGMLAQIARVSSGSVTPAERVLVGLLRDASADTLAPSRDLPQLDSLFQLVVADRSPDFAVRAAAADRRHAGLVRRAWQEIDAGRGDVGEGLLVEARRLQSELVAERLGKVGALGYVALIGRALDLSRTDGEGSAVRYRSMRRSALDLCADARAAIRDGRLADAFDVASHAAGLANALQDGAGRH